MKLKDTIIAIVGCGVIGRSWAIVFARAGADVRLFDAAPEVASRSIEVIRKTLSDIGVDEGEIADAGRRLSVASTLKEALDGAGYAQESVAETIEIKRAIFEQMDKAAAQGCILASSCSSIPPDAFMAGLAGGNRCLIAHPFNPPHLIPVVEIVPGKETSALTIGNARRLMTACRQYPVLLKKPAPGFIGNRLQTAVVSEVMHLIAEEVASPEDIDACLRFGLGLRWALMGPIETMDLNADGGLSAYIEKFGADYHALAKNLGVKNPWSEKAVAEAIASRRKLLPLDRLRERMGWRDRALLEIRQVVARARDDDQAAQQEARK